MTLAAVATFLRASPKAWVDLTANQKDTARNVLLPKITGFDGEQRAWFKDWWMACTQAQVDTMNALLPANVRVAPKDISGSLYLNIDIITDVLNPGDTYYPARMTLRSLVFTNITPQ